MEKMELIKREGLKGNPNLGLIGATLGFFIGFAAVSLYGPAAKNFKEILGLSGISLGLLVSIPQLTGSLLRIPFGAMADKFGGKKAFMILFLLSIIGMAGLIFILFNYFPDKLRMSHYPLILFFGALCGCGVATFPVGISQVSYWFPQKKQGYVLGIYGGLGNTAPGIFTLLLPFALSNLGLPKAYLLWFIFLILGTILYALISCDSFYFQLKSRNFTDEESKKIAFFLGQEIFPSSKFKEALIISAKNIKTWILFSLYFTSFGGFLALTTWLPSYFSLFHNLDIKTSGVLTALFFSILASLFRVLGGAISDKIGGERLSLFSFIIILIGSLILSFSFKFFFCFLGVILMSVGMGIANAAIFKLVPKYIKEAVGGAAGWIGGLGAFGGFAVPPVLGYFVDLLGNTGFARGFLVYALLSFISVLIIKLFLKGKE